MEGGESFKTEGDDLHLQREGNAHRHASYALLE